MLKSYGWGGLVAHKILVSAPVPLELILTGFDWVLGRGLTTNGFLAILTMYVFLFCQRDCRSPVPVQGFVIQSTETHYNFL